MFDLSTSEQVIGSLISIIGGGVAYLAKRIHQQEKRCNANEKQCREDAAACHEKIETLLSTMLANTFEFNKRQESLIADLKSSYDHNARAIAGFSSSGQHQAITQRIRKRRK